MRQRVMIAMAISCEPELLICDEPTTALDVTVQAQVLELLKQLRVELNMGVLLVTHDLSVIAETSDRVVTMYAGQVVERSDVRPLFERPGHPYSLGLLRSILAEPNEDGELAYIPGRPPDLGHRPPACRFAPRCWMAQDVCHKMAPPLIGRALGEARCHFTDDVPAVHHPDATIVAAESVVDG
jgi:oligopeptide transport system ATP-binding protein